MAPQTCPISLLVSWREAVLSLNTNVETIQPWYTADHEICRTRHKSGQISLVTWPVSQYIRTVDKVSVWLMEI